MVYPNNLSGIPSQCLKIDIFVSWNTPHTINYAWRIPIIVHYEPLESQATVGYPTEIPTAINVYPYDYRILVVSCPEQPLTNRVLMVAILLLLVIILEYFNWYCHYCWYRTRTINLATTRIYGSHQAFTMAVKVLVTIGHC